MAVEITRYNNIQDINDAFGIETLHPLVTVMDLSKIKTIAGEKKYIYGFYTVFLKDMKCGNLTYGRQTYDYQEGTLVFIAPGQVYGVSSNNSAISQPRGLALCFHPDLLRGLELGRRMKDYHFFSYEVNEALHISQRERETIVEVKYQP